MKPYTIIKNHTNDYYRLAFKQRARKQYLDYSRKPILEIGEVYTYFALQSEDCVQLFYQPHGWPTNFILLKRIPKTGHLTDDQVYQLALTGV